MPGYHQDFYTWTQEQAALLKAGRLSELDVPNLIEEVFSMGAKDKSSLRSYIRILLMHLLKYKYQPEYRSRSWQSTINYCRDDIVDLITDSPSLRTYIDEMMQISYKRAVNKAADETGIFKENFPTECPWTFDQITNDEFFPD